MGSDIFLSLKDLFIMSKGFRSSLDQRRMTAQTRYSETEDDPVEPLPPKLTKGGNYQCGQRKCKRIYRSEEEFYLHCQQDHMFSKKGVDRDPKPFQGGLPSLGKKRK